MAAAKTQLEVVVILPENTGGDPLVDPVLAAAENGAVMAQEELGFSATILDLPFELSVSVVRAGADALVETARQEIAGGAMALVGGTRNGEAAALAAVAEEAGVPFFNLADSDPDLRNEGCRATTFHIAPDAAMYLDALAGWYVRAGFRRWFVIAGDGADAEALADLTADGLADRHFGARVVGSETVDSGAGAGALARQIGRDRADLVLLILPAAEQLAALESLDAAGVEALVAGYPYAEAQTRAFFEASRAASPRLGAGFRVTDWEPTLDAYGAREFNARYRLRFETLMEPTAWATYQAVKAAFEAASFGGAQTPADVVAYLSQPDVVFDVWKGIGTSFRPWNRQLRQSLYLVKINTEGKTGLQLVQLVGELPAIYMPGTDLVERLDQLGGSAEDSGCRR